MNIAERFKNFFNAISAIQFMNSPSLLKRMNERIRIAIPNMTSCIVVLKIGMRDLEIVQQNIVEIKTINFGLHTLPI